MKITTLSKSRTSPPKAYGAQTTFSKYHQGFPDSRSFGFLIFFAILVANGNSLLAQSFSYQGIALDLGSGHHELTTATADERGAMWEQSTIDFSEDFEIKFLGLFGRWESGGEGMALVFQNTGTSAIGGTGAAMGFASNPPHNAISQSLAIEFDTHDDGPSRGDGSTANDHIAFVANGNQASPLIPIVDLKAGAQNVEDNVFHQISVSWDAAATTMRVFFEGDLRTTITYDFVTNIFTSPMVYWGFTGSTGTPTNQQRICYPSYCSKSPEFQASIGEVFSGVAGDGEEAFSVKPANGCGYIAAGHSSPATTYGNLMVAKTDNDGNTDWLRTYTFNTGSTTIDQGKLYNIEALGNGYIATGWTRSSIRSAIVLRLKNDGSVWWASVQGSSHIWEEGYDIEPTPDRGFILVGSEGGRVFMIHLNRFGVEDWSKTYGREGEVWKGYSVEPIDNNGDGIKDDGFVICGSRRSTVGQVIGDQDWMVITTNEIGELQTAESIGVWGQNDEAFSVKQVDIDGDGILDPNHYVVGGYISDAIGANPQRQIAAFAHYTPSGVNGNPTPVVILDDGVNESRINDLEQDLNGDIVCAGPLMEAGSTLLRDGFFVKSSLDGLYSWSKVYGTTGADDWFNSIEEAGGLGYVLAGGTESSNTGDGDFYIVKIDQWGSSPCNTLDRPYAGAPVEMYSYVENPLEEDFAELTLTPMKYLPVNESADVCHVIRKKEGNATSVNQPKEQPISVYPNPVSNGSSLQIVIDQTFTGNAEIVLTDITGKTHLMKQYTITQGASELSLPINNLSPGMYHVSVQTSQGTSVYKVLIE